MILLMLSIILVILLSYFGNLRGEWNKPNERSAAITFKDFLTLYKISPEKWLLKYDSVVYINKDTVYKDVYFVTFKEYYKYYKWYKKYSKEKAIEHIRKGSFIDVAFKDDVIDINEYSDNDMW